MQQIVEYDVDVGFSGIIFILNFMKFGEMVQKLKLRKYISNTVIS
jgi:hypothetical protein